MHTVERLAEIKGEINGLAKVRVTPAYEKAMEETLQALYKEHYEVEQQQRRYGRVQATLWLSGEVAELEETISGLLKENQDLVNDVDTHKTMLVNTSQMKDDALKALTAAQTDLDKYKRLFLDMTTVNQEKDTALKRLQGQIDFLEEGVAEEQAEKKELQSRIAELGNEIEAARKLITIYERDIHKELSLPLLPAELGGVASPAEVAQRLKKKRKVTLAPAPAGMPGGAGESA